MAKFGIIGAGAWGTALTAILNRAGHHCVLWAHEREVIDGIAGNGRNPLFLSDIDLSGVTATGDLAVATDADAVLLVTPAQFLRSLCRQLQPHWRSDLPAVICAKGIETASFATMSEVVAAELPAAPLAVLSGPTFAIEVAKGLPTAITLACRDRALGLALVEKIGTQNFRPYLTDDVAGTEMGGAVKNVLAIACGVVEGLGFGDNGRAALITRGLAEMMRLAVAKGARAETCMGLSGLGDLILTASSQQSRNYSLGFALGEGKSLDEILASRRSVTEGVATAASVTGLAAALQVEMPICEAVAGLLYRGCGIEETIHDLLARPFRGELGSSAGHHPAQP
ncbi:NAD(P)H-dependent glycerol-3-phosphate dehydrogenase [Telmatospirillum sp.]|uniref:NAD(P)H-dependent glycerol-3-phosphate dehydrogenase n=1 Tax=Telmatospirillum sp. TaxID=2079197 RepID=UPI00284FAE35|nr:NAD(P)H-dependent glycerol-3-phosphate dehydrogenase [Telmatospirillum sp.]MDR3439558.1 NAD(P)-dependent glycerol-3-phosphate dehydrogenase [Telmatospirillum sp.]